MKTSPWLPLGIFLGLAFLAAFIGGFATSTSVETWYATLQKPSWNPPRWVFGPVWTLLYILMSVSAWRVWRQGSPNEARRTVRLFAAQLGLNALWSILFFGLHRVGLALIDVLVLWLVLIRIQVRFYVADKLAAVLWAPYVIWVTFATVLNAAIWDLNR